MQPSPRQYYYSSLAGRLPTGSLLTVVTVVTMPLTFFAVVPDRMWILAIHFVVLIAVANGRHAAMPALRKRGMKRTAALLGLSWHRKENLGWLPPDFGYRPDNVECFNVLRGQFRDLDVVIFDSRVTHTVCRRRSDGRNQSSTTTRSEYNVVRVTGREELPDCLLARAGYCDQPSVPIPGSQYCVYSSSDPSHTSVETLITDDVVQMLKQTPGWVIQVRGQQLTVFDDRNFSCRCQVPGNVPAFLEDIARLHSCFVAGLRGEATRDAFSVERALEQQAKAESSTKFRGTRLLAMHVLQRGDSTGVITSFGCLWTMMTLVFFGLAFSTEGMNSEPVLYFLGPIFLLVGVGMLVPGVLAWLSRRSMECSPPIVRVAGDQPSPGSRLQVSFEQKNTSGGVMSDVSVCLQLGQRVLGSHSQTGHAFSNRHHIDSDGDSGQWKRGREVTQTFRIGDVQAGERIRLQHEFIVPQKFRRRAANSAWWGIDATTSTQDRTVWAATYYLPEPDRMRTTLAIPAVVFGVVWGFFGTGVLGTFAFDLLGIDVTGPKFGVLALGFFGGAFGAGFLSYHAARRIALWPIIQPFAESVGRMNLLLQLFGSMVLAMASFFLAFYLADDVYDVFGWQSANQSKVDQADSVPPEKNQPERDERLQAEKEDGSSVSATTGKPQESARDREHRKQRFREAVVSGNLNEVRRMAAEFPHLVEAVLTRAGGRALHQACVHNRVAVARWLIESGADINARNGFRSTPLHVAAFNGRREVTGVLVEFGADLSLKNRADQTAEQLARMHGHQHVADYLEGAMKRQH